MTGETTFVHEFPRPFPLASFSLIPYRFLRVPLFGMDPETAHRMALAALDVTLGTAAARAAARRAMVVDAPELRVRRWGIEFSNPVGLAAGFDKAGRSFNALAALGFGFVEIGTVTAEPQPGNPKPRLFRLPADRALLNRMGFNNPGAHAVARRLARTRIGPVLGVNLGKSRVTPLEEAAEDYLRTIDALQPFARYLAVNVSSPNTPGLRSLQDAGPLRGLIGAVVERVATNARAAGAEAGPPVLVKLAPDLSDAQVEEAVGIALEAGAMGIIATNTTVSREGLSTPAPRLGSLGPGGISGAPVAARARAVVARVHAASGGSVPIIGVGGISSAADAWAMITAGASLVQVYTGFVYEGPGLPRRINRGLLSLLRRDGIGSLDEIVGSGHG